MGEPATLRAWLRKNPQPAFLKFVDGNDKEHTLKLTPGRNCWKNAEQALLASGAVSVQAFNADGTMDRATPLGTAEDDEADLEDTDDRKLEKSVGKERRELAAVLDRYGDRLTQAFKEGASAANTSQDQLVGLVDTLTQHLATALTNLHTISVQFAKTLQESGAPESSNADQLMGQVLALAAAHAQKPNGVAEKEKKP